MLIVVGVTPENTDGDALALTAALAKTFGAKVLVAHIYPDDFHYASKAHVDSEWKSYLRGEATKVVTEGAAVLAEKYGIAAKTTIAGHKSSGVGLALVAKRRDADIVVIGSAPGAAVGRFQIGSTADQLLHGSGCAVGLATASYARTAPEKISELVVDFETKTGRNSIRGAGRLAEQADLPLTLLTVLQRHRVYGSPVGATEEEEMVKEWAAVTTEQQELAAKHLPADVRSSVEVAVASTVFAAIQSRTWSGDELFVLASSPRALLRKVFLHEQAYKVVRATPVPALVLPRA